MKKIIVGMIVALSLISVTSVLAADKISVMVNGSEVIFPDAKPFIESERTLVPIRAIFEALGAKVEWDEDTKTVISYDPSSDTSVVLQIDSDMIFINGQAQTIDVPAKIIDNSTVIPIRAVAEGMKCKVDWEQENATVIINR